MVAPPVWFIENEPFEVPFCFIVTVPLPMVGVFLSRE